MTKSPILKFILTVSGFIFLLLSQNCAYAERPSNEIPMYGGQQEPDVPHNKTYSESAARLGWQYYYKGDLDTAIKRFNQAWMFDRESIDAFWGFGLIIGQRSRHEEPEKNLRESANYLNKAHKLSKNNARIIVDLAYSETLLGGFLKENNKTDFQIHFNRARTLYIKAEKLEKDYPLIYSNWSVLEFYEGNYAAAQLQLATAKKLGYEPDPAYEQALKEKL